MSESSTLRKSGSPPAENRVFGWTASSCTGWPQDCILCCQVTKNARNERDFSVVVRAFTQEVGQMPQAQLLREHAFTQGLSEAQIQTLAKIATPVTFDEDQLILVDGARSRWFYLL